MVPHFGIEQDEIKSIRPQQKDFAALVQARKRKWRAGFRLARHSTVLHAARNVQITGTP
jgi:hypothetical protein